MLWSWQVGFARERPSPTNAGDGTSDAQMSSERRRLALLVWISLREFNQGVDCGGGRSPLPPVGYTMDF